MKLYLIIPDGTGIRNFLFTDFIQTCTKSEIDVTCWARKSLLDLIDNNVNKKELPSLPHTTIKAEIIRRAWQNCMLLYFDKKFNDRVYSSYIFSTHINSLKTFLKTFYLNLLVTTHKEINSISELKKKYEKLIRKTEYYFACRLHLKNERPDILFCTHQRSSEALGPMLAAKDLGIKTACFIYSWDNVPKSTIYVNADYYFVWSAYMKNELLKLHAEIKADNVIITGTPQFTMYFKNFVYSRRELALKYQLDTNKKWICFSGDDITTSPLDQEYLNDFCRAVLRWNETQIDKIHILFRKCPTEISDRYNFLFKRYDNIMTEVAPAWRNLPNDINWNAIVPTIEDNKLLASLVNHCAAVVNIASTMALDFGIREKPCIYINYEKENNQKWSVKKIYNFIHFRSMKNTKPVIWLNDPHDWEQVIKHALYSSNQIVLDNKQWMEIICEHPLEEANIRFVNAFKKIK